jgi:hypothetical protein
LHPVAAVASVAVDGDVLATEDYQIDLKTKPARLSLNSQPTGSILTEYTAGYASAALIPAGLLLGIKMLAAYMYEHRGMCAIGDAAEASGATAIWRPYSLLLGGL